MIAGLAGRTELALETLRAGREEMVALLAALVAIETPSTVPAAQAPAFALLARELARRGYRSRVLPGATSGGLLYARPRRAARTGPRQLLLGHIDTVWPLGTLAHMPVRREGQRLYGPGAFDMKAGIVQMLAALEVLGPEPAVTPVVLITSDEEVGSADSADVIRRLARRVERVFVLEPALGPDGLLKTARKGAGRFTVRVRGRAAHAGLDPGEGASAILELSHVIQGLFALNDPARGTTVNVGTIDGGIRPNVVAAESRAVIDVRVRTPAEAARITDAIHRLQPATAGTALEIEGAIGRPPLEPAASRALMALAREAAAALGLTLGGGEAGGASDGNVAAQHAPTLDGLGAVGDGAHAEHEQVEVERMPERAALLAMLLAAPPLGRDTGTDSRPATAAARL